MNVVECESKALLREAGLTLPRGSVVSTPDAAAEVVRALASPAVLKAQVPTGGRMKAGAVRFAETPDDAAQVARALLGMDVRGFTTGELLVEERLDIAAEIYAGITYDPVARLPIMIASLAGGIDVETGGGFARRELPTYGAVPGYLARELTQALGFSGRDVLALSSLITALARCFFRWDALLLELNPIVLDRQGKWWIADAHLELDDDADYRQKDLWTKLPISRRFAERRTEFERRAQELDKADPRGAAGRLVAFDGDLGLLIGGGGASLTVLDAVLDAGLKPANYSEIGGNPSVWKIAELTKIVLSQPQVTRLAVIMNVVSNTRVDLVARGVIKGILELGRDPGKTIAAFRIPGSWEDEGAALLKHYGVRSFGRETSLEQVVDSIR